MSTQKLEIKIDDVRIVVQSLGAAIQKKVFTPEEFRRFQPSWERLTDVITALERKTALEQLYPNQPVAQPQPVPAAAAAPTSSADGVQPVTASAPKIEAIPLPTEPETSDTAGEPEPELETPGIKIEQIPDLDV